MAARRPAGTLILRVGRTSISAPVNVSWMWLASAQPRRPFRLILQIFCSREPERPNRPASPLPARPPPDSPALASGWSRSSRPRAVSRAVPSLDTPRWPIVSNRYHVSDPAGRTNPTGAMLVPLAADRGAAIRRGRRSASHPLMPPEPDMSGSVGTWLGPVFARNPNAKGLASRLSPCLCWLGD